jgi:Ca2+-transporting ATPase
MLNSLNAISEDNSLLTMNPLINPWLLAAIAWSIGLHIMIVYVPAMNVIFGIAPHNVYEWMLVLKFSFPVIIIDEFLKIIGRKMNADELEERLAISKKNKKV